MRFFKHFTDSHRGQSMQNLLDALGHAGLCFWPLTEMCAEKLDEKMDAKGGERLVEADFVFKFHPRVVRQSLRLSQAKLRVFLSVCQTNDLLSFELSETSLTIWMPKLLKCLERAKKKDVGKTSGRRPKDVLEEEVEEEIEKESTTSLPEPVRISPPKPVPVSDAQRMESRMKFDFLGHFERYPHPQKRTIALRLMAERIHTQADFDALGKAIDNISEHYRREKTELRYILTFPRFFEEWRDWVDWKPGPKGPAVKTPNNLDQSVLEQVQAFYTARAQFGSDEPRARAWLGEWRWSVMMSAKAAATWTAFDMSGDTWRLDLYSALKSAMSQPEEVAP